MKSQNHAEWHNSEFTKFLSNFSYIVMEHFKTATHDNGIPIIATDLRGRILFSNSAAKKMFTNGHGNIIGLPAAKVLHFVQPPQNGNAKYGKRTYRWNKLMREGLLIGAELQKVVKLGNGLQMEVKLSGSPMFDMTGDLKGGAFFIKESKRLKNPLREENLSETN